MHAVTGYKLLAYGLVTLFTATISGISGGGGGFINTPFLILLGLNPAQAIASGKLGGLAVAIGSLKSLSKVRQTSWRRMGAYMLLALVIGLLSPYVIRSLDSQIYRRLLGGLILLLVPLLTWKKLGQRKNHPGKIRRLLGYVLLAGALALQGIFSGGLGTLVNVVLIGFLGTTSLEANVVKRYSQLILNTVIVLGVLGSHLIQWPYAIIGVISGLLGGAVGGHLAVKRGNRLVTAALLVLMVASGLWLVLT